MAAVEAAVSSESSSDNNYDGEAPSSDDDEDICTADDVDNWVACGLCNKWRRVPEETDAAGLSNDWHCSEANWREDLTCAV